MSGEQKPLDLMDREAYAIHCCAEALDLITRRVEVMNHDYAPFRREKQDVPDVQAINRILHYLAQRYGADDASVEGGRR